MNAPLAIRYWYHPAAAPGVSGRYAIVVDEGSAPTAIIGYGDTTNAPDPWIMTYRIARPARTLDEKGWRKVAARIEANGYHPATAAVCPWLDRNTPDGRHNIAILVGVTRTPHFSEGAGEAVYLIRTPSDAARPDAEKSASSSAQPPAAKEPITTADAVAAIGRGIRSREVSAEQIECMLASMVNGGRVETVEGFANALSNDHPTLSGQIARAVALGIMRRCRYDPTWRAFDPLWKEGDPICTEPMATRSSEEFGGSPLPKHGVHDGRLDCTTVIGAALLARQSCI